MKPHSRSLFLLFVGLTLATFLYREWVTIATPIRLFYDEAYYLSWAQTPEWGYYSKPPVVAWLIHLTTQLFGNDEWAVKLAAPLLYCFSAVLLYRIGQRLFGPAAGFLAGLIFLFMPLISFNSLFITTDAPLVFFWCAAFYAFVRARADRQWRWWLTAGLCGGLGLLSKYTFILFPAGFLAYAAVSEDGRRLLRQPGFWVACLLALACLLPNLWWNYQHDFISFQHTAEISKQGERPLSLSRLLEFWAGQLVVFGPLFSILLIVRALRRHPWNDNEKLLWCLFWPTFVAISLQALLARANLNWAAAAYVSASLLAGHYLSSRPAPWRLRAAVALNLVLMFGFYHFTLVTDTLGIERKDGTDPFKRIKGWPELVQRFQPYVDRYPEHKLASNSRKLLAYFGYYLKPQDFSGVALNSSHFIDDHYELNYPLSESPYRQFLFITEGWSEQQLGRYFSEVELVTEQAYAPYSNFVRSARLYRVRGFKGLPAAENPDD